MEKIWGVVVQIHVIQEILPKKIAFDLGEQALAFIRMMLSVTSKVLFDFDMALSDNFFTKTVYWLFLIY